MEMFLVVLLVSLAFSYLVFTKLQQRHKAKCSDCSATSCTSCPLATAPTLKKHLETRKNQVVK